MQNCILAVAFQSVEPENVFAPDLLATLSSEWRRYLQYLPYIACIIMSTARQDRQTWVNEVNNISAGVCPRSSRS
jgi:hypothetical protein